MSEKESIFTADEVLEILRSEVIDVGSQQKLAKMIGISKQYLNDVLHRRRGITEPILQFVGMSKITFYVSKHNNHI